MRKPLAEAVYLLLGLPLSAVAFGVLVAGTVAGGILAITIVGLPVLLGFFLAARGIAEVERRRAALLVGPVDSRYRRSPRPGLVPRFKTAATDGTTWRDLSWLVLLTLLGFAGGILVVVFYAVLLYCLSLPLWWWAVPHSALPDVGPSWTVDTWGRVGLAVGACLVAAVPVYFLVKGLAQGQARLARWVLSPSRKAELEERVDELARTRAAAADAQTGDLRRIERDLHDGAQARLVALSIDLGLAREKLDTEPEAARALVDAAHEDAKSALAELRELVRGVHPAVLTDRGLDGALAALAARSPVPVTLEVEPGQRPAPAVEAAAYFVVAEGLANVAKHSGASRSKVRVSRPNGNLVVEVSDDGAGGAHEAAGSGIAGLADRVRALDGSLALASPPGGPTTLRAELPCAS
jgi:signal transduction histidine kinase